MAARQAQMQLLHGQGQRGDRILMLSSAAAAVALLRAINRVHHPDGLVGHLRLHNSSVLGVKLQGGTFAHAAARRIAPAAAAVLLDRVILPNLHLHLRG